MGKIIIVGKLKDKINLKNKDIQITDSLNDLSSDFICDLIDDSKKAVGYDSSKVESHSKNFADEITKYAKRNLVFNQKKFKITLSRKTYEKNVLIECCIEYEMNNLEKDIFNSVYEFKMRIKEWLKKYCKFIYWIHDDNNSKICSYAYNKIYNVENMLRQILSLFMMRKCGDIYLNKELESKCNDYSNFYKAQGYSDFKDINSKLYNIDFLKLPKLLDLNVSQAVVNEEGTIKQLVGEIICELSDICNITYSYKKIESLKKELNSKISKINSEKHIFNERLLSILDNEFRMNWEKLSGMRNMVMHNKPICKALFNDIENLCEDMMRKFELCLENIENCFYTEEEFIYDCLCDEASDRERYKFEFIEQERENKGIEFQLSEDYVMNKLSENQQEIEELMIILNNIKELSSKVEDIYEGVDKISEYLRKKEDKKVIEKISSVSNELDIEINFDDFYISHGKENLIDKFIYKVLNNYDVEELYNNLVDNTEIDEIFSINNKIADFRDYKGERYQIYVKGELNPLDDEFDYILCILNRNDEAIKQSVIQIDYGSYLDEREGGIDCEQMYIVNEELNNIYEDLEIKLKLISVNIEKVMRSLNIN